jgi:hypothetical protein
LGDGGTEDRLTPVRIPGLTNIREIAAGANHLCAIDRDGLAYCLGDNTSGQLGDGTQTSRATPVPVVGIGGFSKIVAGPSHTCGLIDTGELYCWGENLGQFGPAPSAPIAVPTRVLEQRSFDVATDYFNTCVLISRGGHALCAGTPAALGGTSGSGWRSLTRDDVLDYTGFESVWVGASAACYREGNGRVLCAGAVLEGATLSPLNEFPVFAAATQITLGSPRCFIRGSGQLLCQGAWRGDGSTSYFGWDDPSFVEISVPSGARSIVKRPTFPGACVVSVDRRVRCWGPNSNGELGDGTYRARYFPTEVKL